MTLAAVPCTVMRGGTSKGLYFRARDLPQDIPTRDAVLMALMGTPDARQIDGLGGAHPLTSKVAVVSPSSRADADVDYLFLQLGVDATTVSDAQTCGNLLAGAGGFAVEAGMVDAVDGVTDVRVHLVNTHSLAIVSTPTPCGRVEYEGEARIDGAPGSAAPILIEFLDVAGGSCGALLPTGHLIDVVDGFEVTLIDNGMPVVVMRAADFGVTGAESPQVLEAMRELCPRIESIRHVARSMMNLGDVAEKSVPKMCLLAPAQNGGTVGTRTWFPHRVHEAIGVFGAVSVASACPLPRTVAEGLVDPLIAAPGRHVLQIEHPPECSMLRSSWNLPRRVVC
jgi:4-oxalomesaconate tautomerase